MGFQPRLEGGTCHLRLEGQELAVPANDWGEVLGEAQGWLDRLGDDAQEQGEALARRRREAGFDFDGFVQFTALDPGVTFEAEAGLQAPLGVHLRILDWLESERLSR